eukprot:Skav232275  [mRNA]  locus=scaffold882:180523:184838:- [translate_table: standard]
MCQFDIIRHRLAQEDYVCPHCCFLILARHFEEPTPDFETMAMTPRVKNSMFFTIRDNPYSQAEKLITDSTLAALNTCYKPSDQTTVFFAAARQTGQDSQASALCRMLLERGVPINHTDELHQTALFYAALQGHAGTIKRRYRGREQLAAYMYEPQGKGMQANEWPIKEHVVAQQIEYKDEDVVQSADGYVVVKNAPANCASRLRVSEKNFVVDHTELLEGEPWLKELTPEDWCKTVGVITDEAGHAVNGIETVVSGRNPEHFTLQLVETKTKNIAGYVHATYTPEKKEMAIAHDSEHIGKGLGGLLIDAAEDHSKFLGWTCKKTYLSVLKANARARRCYLKAGFKFESGDTALWRPKEHPASEWGPKEHPASEWQRWRKEHKHHENAKEREEVDQMGVEEGQALRAELRQERQEAREASSVALALLSMRRLKAEEAREAWLEGRHQGAAARSSP